jgi:hypothetical protein
VGRALALAPRVGIAVKDPLLVGGRNGQEDRTADAVTRARFEQEEQLLARSCTGAEETEREQGADCYSHPGTALPFSLWRRESDLLLLTVRALD